MGAIPIRFGAATRTLLLALALLFAALQVAQAQEVRGKKKWILALLGAVAVGVPAYIASNDDQFDSFCSTKTCTGFLGASLGGLVGYLIGSELDTRYERKMAAGPDIDYAYRVVPLDLVPDRLAYFPGGAAIVGVGGARLVSRDGTTRERAAGVRGIEDVAVLTRLDLMVLSTFSNLIAFPIEGDSVQGDVVDQVGGGAMEPFGDQLAVAGLDSLRLLRVRRDAESISVETLAGVESSDFVTDIAYASFNGVVWLLLEDRLVSFSSDLEKLGELQLPGTGRTVRVRGSRLAVAAGSDGVYVLDSTDPMLPRFVLHYEGVRFAYAADLDGDRLYVAAGPEGVAIVDISGREPSVLGVARSVRFANDVVAAGGGEVWILDREGRSVQIAEFATEATSEPGGGR